MWFLIKGTFWFSLVLVALSYFGAAQNESQTSTPMNVAGAVSAANEAYRYVSAICIEKPDVCAQGAETFHALAGRARDGAKVAYEFLDTQIGVTEDKTTAELTTASTGTPNITVEFPQNAEKTAAPFVPVPQKRPAL
ncbi:DUF5330 domain-containing protein [Agrobacterium sp.]|jgi:hypothetical protein|uniref:DUF5330 domain-containing protein n=1 Tax=Agrobacterium sp. TaxID=361 RepID=UPI0028A72C80|nr:DUF5330 domain-containing protein [Agrobacterium sp.]